MKKNIFNIILSFVLLFVVSISLASCGEAADYTIGVLQIQTHDALGKATQGFKDVVEARAKEEGKTVKIIVKNPEGDQAQLTSMAAELIDSCDLVLGNATPAATALAAAAKTKNKDIPILFTSVTDPVDAGLVDSLAKPGKNVTGTSDLNPISMQIDLIFDFDPTVDKVGFLYNISESNSKVQCDEAEAYIKDKKPGVTCVTKTVSDTTGITAAFQQLKDEGADAVYIPTDNLLASNMTIVSNANKTCKLPVICGESGMALAGGTFSLSISYLELGKTTGEMANKILFDNVAAKDIPVEMQTDAAKFEFTMNEAGLTAIGKELSQSFKEKYNLK